MIPASCLMKPFCLLLPLLLAGCSQLPRLSGLSTEADPNVVFALGSREGFQSPLLAPLKPANVQNTNSILEAHALNEDCFSLVKGCYSLFAPRARPTAALKKHEKGPGGGSLGSPARPVPTSL